jgi:hypothetical protein
LVADAQAVSTEFAGHPHISVIPLGYEPPEAYRVVFRVPGVYLDASGQPTRCDESQAVIQLGSGYPREKPVAIMETPIFHPNIGGRVGEEICIGDYWSPAQTLVDIIVTVGELIQYQRYNTRSPLNAVAARWAANNEQIFPIGRIDLYPPEPDISLRGPSPGGPPRSGSALGSASGGRDRLDAPISTRHRH